jgi:hypothetical protein
VIVTFLSPERQLLSSFGTGLLETFRLKLLRKELVCEALVHEDIVEIAA